MVPSNGAEHSMTSKNYVPGHMIEQQQDSSESTIRHIDFLLNQGDGEQAIQLFLQHEECLPASSIKQRALQQLIQWQSAYRSVYFIPGESLSSTLTAVFIPRSAFTIAMLRVLKRFIEKQGYEVVDVLSFANNWGTPPDDKVLGAGREPVGGAFICLDLCPWAPSTLDQVAWPKVDNVRNLTLQGLGKRVAYYRANGHARLLSRAMLHGLQHLQVVKNTEATWDWLNSLPDTTTASYRKRISEWQDAFEVPFPVEVSLSRFAGSARVDLVQYRGQRAVCKTFRPEKHDAMANECAIYAHAQSDDRIPKVLETGEGWLVTEYVEGIRPLKDDTRCTIAPEIVVRAFRWLQHLHHAGYVHTDFHPENVFQREDGTLCFIDFEHCFRWTDVLPPFEESPTFNPQGWDELALPSPIGGPRQYKHKWAPYTSLPQDELLSTLG